LDLDKGKNAETRRTWGAVALGFAVCVLMSPGMSTGNTEDMNGQMTGVYAKKSTKGVDNRKAKITVVDRAHPNNLSIIVRCGKVENRSQKQLRMVSRRKSQDRESYLSN